MAQIVINEISQNYTYNIGTNAYATVALPITAMWGPGYEDPYAEPGDESTLVHVNADELENVVWTRFPSTSDGLRAFVSTYRGPASVARLAQDNSYNMAMTLLSAGYDVLVCRVATGNRAKGHSEKTGLGIHAKYLGSFGNNIRVRLVRSEYAVYPKPEDPAKAKKPFWNLIVYVLDSYGTSTAVENFTFVFDINNATDSIPYIGEISSNFVTFEDYENLDDNMEFGKAEFITLGSEDGDEGSDIINTYSSFDEVVNNYTQPRFNSALRMMGKSDGDNPLSYAKYIELLTDSELPLTPLLSVIAFREFSYFAACKVYTLLSDKLTYNPNRIISPGWDDQDFVYLYNNDYSQAYEAIDNLGGQGDDADVAISPMHIALMNAGYLSRCGCAYIDIPRSIPRSMVYTHYVDGSDGQHTGYAQKLARFIPHLTSYNLDGTTSEIEIVASLYPTHSALFAPWGHYTYVGTSKQNVASPSFIALMIQRSQILNQAAQYEWALPSNRKHTLRIGKLDYNVPKKYLDQWQTLEGVGVNAISNIPDLGINVWGNSTLYEVPPATYQALANLSTRLLVNAVENVAYRVGVSITFQYNNNEAYDRFYAGVTPILDTMKNVGAIDDYYVKMAADINGLDQVNANTVIGKIYLVVNGVINDIYIDLIALPPGTDLNQYRV